MNVVLFASCRNGLVLTSRVNRCLFRMSSAANKPVRELESSQEPYGAATTAVSDLSVLTRYATSGKTQGEYDLRAVPNLLVSIDHRKKTAEKLTQSQERLRYANVAWSGFSARVPPVRSKRTEEPCANLELEQYTVFTHANEGICITDPEGTLMQCVAWWLFAR